MKTYKIYLIRHGLTEGNDRGQYIGRTDLPLSPEGLSQLLQMKEQFEYPKPRKFYAAPLSRCRQTLNVLFPKCQVEDVEGLTECDFGDWEGKTVNELRSNPVFKDWVAGKQGEIPGGEAAADFQQRVMAAFEATVETILKSGETESVICVPGGVLMLIMTVYGLPQMEMKEWATSAGCGFCLRVTPEIWMREPVGEALCAIPWQEDSEDN